MTGDELARTGHGLLLRGDLVGAHDAFVRASAAYRAGGRVADATLIDIAAARLAIARGALDDADALLGDADAPEARAELAEARGDLAGWRTCTTSADRALARRAWLVLGRHARNALDNAALVVAIEGSLALAENPRAEADLRIELAVAIATADPARAAAELDRAAPLVGDDRVLRSRLSGQRGVLAMIADDLDRARSLAEQARDLAVAATDVPAYLASALLLAMIHTRRGDEVAELDVLLRARASLGDLLGDNGREMIAPALRALEDRLGAAGFAEVRARWRYSRAR